MSEDIAIVEKSPVDFWRCLGSLSVPWNTSFILIKSENS